MPAHLNFQTTAAGGLHRAAPPMRLFEKAKRFGIWNPSDIDFSQDKTDWQRLNAAERDVLLHLTALFQAGEEAVTGDILPLLLAISREGRVEEELYLTTFLFEEAKHTDFFRRFLDEVAGVQHDLAHYHSPSYREKEAHYAKTREQSRTTECDRPRTICAQHTPRYLDTGADGNAGRGG